MIDPRYLQQVEAVRSQGSSLPLPLEFVAVLEDSAGPMYRRPATALAVLTPEAAVNARARFHISSGEFHVVLFGKDQSVVLESPTPLTGTRLVSLI